MSLPLLVQVLLVLVQASGPRHRLRCPPTARRREEAAREAAATAWEQGEELRSCCEWERGWRSGTRACTLLLGARRRRLLGAHERRSLRGDIQRSGGVQQ